MVGRAGAERRRDAADPCARAARSWRTVWRKQHTNMHITGCANAHPRIWAGARPRICSLPPRPWTCSSPAVRALGLRSPPGSSSESSSAGDAQLGGHCRGRPTRGDCGGRGAPGPGRGAWPALPIGIVGAGLAATVARDVAAGAVRQGGISSPAGRSRRPAESRCSSSSLRSSSPHSSLIAPPASLVVLVALGWLWLSRRRREATNMRAFASSGRRKATVGPFT